MDRATKLASIERTSLMPVWTYTHINDEPDKSGAIEILLRSNVIWSYTDWEEVRNRLYKKGIYTIRFHPVEGNGRRDSDTEGTVTLVLPLNVEQLLGMAVMSMCFTNRRAPYHFSIGSKEVKSETFGDRLHETHLNAIEMAEYILYRYGILYDYIDDYYYDGKREKSPEPREMPEFKLKYLITYEHVKIHARSSSRDFMDGALFCCKLYGIERDEALQKHVRLLE